MCFSSFNNESTHVGFRAQISYINRICRDPLPKMGYNLQLQDHIGLRITNQNLSERSNVI